MAVRTQDCTKEYLTSVALPTHAESYTVISHEFIINHTMEQLALHGFQVEKETYRSNSDGSIAQGVYYLNYTKDPEVGLMFAWSNSYNKLMRFKCAIGGYVFICMNGVVAGDMGSWGRKHLGSADTETVKAIVDQISNADIHFDRIVADKDVMKKITLTERKQAELLGILYAEYEILTNEQISIVKQQMDKPGYDYNCEINSLWAFYNHVTHALKKAHPRDWMDDQRKLHWFIAFEFDLINYTEDAELLPIDELELNYGEPENQLNILTEIEKAEEIEELTQLAEDREQAERDIVFYEDPAGNTFEAPVVDDIKIHIESDEEYNARVAAIEGEPELELPTTDQIIFEGLRAADEAKAEREELEIKRVVSELKASNPEAFEKLENDLFKIEQDLVFGDSIKVMDEVEEVKPTETKIVDDWDDDDFNFDLDDTKKDDHGGEFFL
jgi:hypothetical protein